MSNDSRWWGDFNLVDEQLHQWSTGPRQFVMQKSQRELVIWDLGSSTESHDAVTHQLIQEHSIDDAKAIRIILPEDDSNIMIEPSVADRTMVVKPSRPLTLLSEQEVDVFIGTPLWFTVMHKKLDLPLIDQPLFRPSDTWFGNNTMEGAMCYARLSEAKSSSSDLLGLPTRAYTRLTLKNQQPLPIKVERLAVPMPELSVYVDDKGMFWTDSVLVSQSFENGVSRSKVESVQLSEANNTLVSEARVKSQKSSIISSFKSLIG